MALPFLWQVLAPYALRAPAPVNRGLVLSYSALCRSAFIAALRLSERFSFWVLASRWASRAIAAPDSNLLAFSAFVASAASYDSCSAAPLPWRGAFPWAAAVFKSGRSLWPPGLTVRRSRPPSAATEIRLGCTNAAR
ncbi:DUF1010 domain-containing protein [Paracidovorax valerianellae]|uniref:DUF1010 domain-containing protein n=1 Tax=Paracidovorax valerianellae TaxID=187868 RepID=UPI0011146406|nr:DUF1010 domain-containing protein [Paracidovorax valerianellae]MDA8446559.1 DUF1010 domain-containing protein [Paracidovorax valerianellae]